MKLLNILRWTVNLIYYLGWIYAVEAIIPTWDTIVWFAVSSLLTVVINVPFIVHGTDK